jgi:hypothetical protein
MATDVAPPLLAVTGDRPTSSDASGAAAPRSGFIAGPWQDSIFLIGAPLIAILAYVPFYFMPSLSEPVSTGLAPWSSTATAALLQAFINAHLAAVFFRSHGNANIFKQYPLRFLVVPLVLLIAMWVSDVALAIGLVLGVWWDVYHSSMQTFGLGRIYDMKAGNDAQAGRTLDRCLNLLLYVGPIVGGASLVLHLRTTDSSLQDYAGLRTAVFQQIPFSQQYLALGVLAVGLPFVAFYLWGYYRLSRQGYRVSPQKVALFIILAGVSLACWGFNSFGEAFFVMNFFHALQYFFIVWFMERKNLTAMFGLSGYQHGRTIALALFIFLPFAFGALSVIDMRWMPIYFYRGYLSLLLVVSLLHYWYDGFIWSVRKKQVA